jgi:GTP cyclohydrolase II
MEQADRVRGGSAGLLPPFFVRSLRAFMNHLTRLLVTNPAAAPVHADGAPRPNDKLAGVTVAEDAPAGEDAAAAHPSHLQPSPPQPSPLQPAQAQPGRPHSSRPHPSRYVRHAILDARAGLPVLVFAEDGTAPALVVLAAETSTEAGLAGFRAATRGDAQLLLAPSRAETMLAAHPAGQAATSPQMRPQQRQDALANHKDEVSAFGISPDMLTPAGLQALADPTRAQSGGALTGVPARPLAAAALLLAKLGHLLPAMVVAEANPGCGLVSVSATDILTYQGEANASLVRVAEAVVPLAEAQDARLVAFRPSDGGAEHVALLIGRPEHADAPLVRIHSECFTGDMLGSLRCDCGPQLHQAIRRMEAEGSGVLLYMAQEGRGIGLVNKLRAYALQDRGLDTLDANRALGWGADERDFTAAALMLRDLGVTRVRLLTNNPEKTLALADAGIEVTARLRHAIAANGVNDSYLDTKARRFGHLLGEGEG